MDHRHPVILQTLGHRAEIAVEPGHADMLEHADRHDAIILPPGFTIVAQFEPYLLVQIRSLGPRHGDRHLLGRQRNARHLCLGFARQMHRHATPAAADIQHTHAGRQIQLVGNMLLLRRLRLLQTHVRPSEIGTRILHVLVQEQPIQTLRQVVMVRHMLTRRLERMRRHHGLHAVQKGGEPVILRHMPQIGADQHHERPQIAALDRHPAVSPCLAQAKIGIDADALRRG